VALLGGGVYRNWDLLLQGAVVGEKRTVALPVSALVESDVKCHFVFIALPTLLLTLHFVMTFFCVYTYK
jgi:hypothetical protein